MALGIVSADPPDLFTDKAKKELPVESINGTDKTAYLKINLKVDAKGGQPVDPMTAVFAPDPTALSGDVDVLLWLHGDKSYWNKDHSTEIPFSGKSIQYYLNKLPLCRLREFILRSSKKKFILVAPTLNDKTGASVDAYNPDKSKRDFSPGALRWKDADAETYLKLVLKGVQAHMGVSNQLTLGNVVLAAHSGGGHLQSQMAKDFGGAFKRMNEVWCFDSSYWGADPFIAWLKKGHSDARLFMHSTGGTTGYAAAKVLDLAPDFLGLTPQPPPAKPVRARTPVAKVQAGISSVARAITKVEELALRGLEIALKTTKIDVLIENNPNTGKPDWTDFSLAMFGGMAGGHYEGIEKYLTTLVETSRNLT